MEIEIKVILELDDSTNLRWVPETMRLTHWRSVAMLPLMVSELIDGPPVVFDLWMQSLFHHKPEVN